MAEHELKKMSRGELLTLLMDMEKENSRLKQLVEKQKAELESKEVNLKDAGTMAEAALRLNHVFEDADRAAAEYLEILKESSSKQKEMYDKTVSDARKYTELSREKADRESKAMIEEAERKASAIIDDAEKQKEQRIKEADEYWKNVSVRLEAFYSEHAGLKELLNHIHG